MKKLTKIIKDATAEVDPEYFYLSIAGSDPIYRERVYCYELYHQMRLCWPADTKFYLNGEVDKAGHPELKKLEAKADHVKPDLLVHQPGYGEGNHAIIEVKSPNANNDGICKDLKNLSLFKRKVGYKRAIYLIYGDKAAYVAKQVIAIAKKVQKFELEPIELWLHKEPGKSAVRYTTLRRPNTIGGR